MKKLILMALWCASTLAVYAVKTRTVSLQSPDKRIEVLVNMGDQLTYCVSCEGEEVLSPSVLSMTLDNGDVWGTEARLSRRKSRYVCEDIPSPFYRSDRVHDEYNDLMLTFRGGWGLEFRAYNDGVAYRFVSERDEPFRVVSEEVEYNFDRDCAATVAYVDKRNASFKEQFFNSFENAYTTLPLSQLDGKRLAMLPAVVDWGNGKKVCLVESDLEAYPGLYLQAAGGTSLRGMFAPYPRTWHQGGHNNLQAVVDETEDYIARVDGPRTFPWRGMVIACTDKDLAASDLVYRLASPSRLADTSWIRPGKVAWEWWNDCNLEGVDFKTGINNDTYKYYIDFAAAHGIEYVILDEGWAVNLKADLMQVIPEIDLPALVEYGRQKGVGIVLWAGYLAFERDMENVCRHYAEMGVKGFKVDFMDRDDQEMVEFVHRAAETAARQHLILDLHGMYKPSGLNRTWPNVLNFEGAFGLEQMKFRRPEPDMVTYDVTIPFIRQVVGPMDYTQGAMRNATKGNSFICFSEPMSQGTRCHQLAAYVVFDSPLTMLCDSPTSYQKEAESLDFIAGIPTVWDETRVLDGQLGKYIVTARRSKDVWYVGALNGWEARDVEVDLSFLGKYDLQLVLYKDGLNADRKGTDYTKESVRLNADRKLTVHLAPGGGFALRVETRQ